MNMSELNRTLKAAQKQVESHRVDAQELDRLLQEKTAELQQAQSARDFKAMASLEAERAALEGMRSREQSAAATAEAHVEEIEAQRFREAQLQGAAAKSLQIVTTRQELHDGLLALSATLTTELERLIGLVHEWRTTRASAIEDLDNAGGLNQGAYSRAFNDSVLKEVQARGGNPDALRLTLGFMPEISGSREEALPTPPHQVSGYSLEAFSKQVKALTGQLFHDARHIHGRANSRKALEHRAQREGSDHE